MSEIKEYPKAVYKGGVFAEGVEPVEGRDYLTVHSAAQEKDAAKDGFVPFGAKVKAAKSDGEKAE